GKYRFGGLGPHEWLWAGVMAQEVVVDRILELGNAREGATSDALGRNLGEEALDEIEPRRARRREVAMEARMICEPRLHHVSLVRPVVVEHEMHIEVPLLDTVDALQEADELLGAMPRLAFADDETALDVERCKQGGRAVPLVIV